MKNILINSKLRTIGKILLSVVSVNIIALVSCILGSLIYQNVHITNFTDMLSNTMNSDLGYVLCIVITTILVYLFYKYITKKEKTNWEDLGFSKKHRFSQLINGFLLGIIFVATYIFILIVMKQVSFEFNRLNSNILYSLFMGAIIFCGVAFAEEITYRGYIQNLLSKKNKYIGLIITAVIFALSHLLNSSYSLLSLIYLTIGGILLGLMRMEKENIWFPLGFHIAWNWTEIRIFGLGNDMNSHWFSTNVIQNTIWNGGESGTGIIIVLVELVLIVLFVYLYLRKNQNKTDNYSA
jgi:hypothetical protein